MDLLKQFQKYWQLVAICIALITAWVNIQNSVKQLEARTTANESKIETQIAGQNEIKVQLSQIQTDLIWIRKTLEK